MGPDTTLDAAQRLLGTLAGGRTALLQLAATHLPPSRLIALCASAETTTDLLAENHAVIERRLAMATRRIRAVELVPDHGGDERVDDAPTPRGEALPVDVGAERGRPAARIQRSLGRADVVVAADTGPLHLAAAAGTRCVALFGPKDPTRYGPRAHGGIAHEVLFHDVPCRPCRLRDCVSPQCVLGLTVEVVEAAVRRQLARVRAP